MSRYLGPLLKAMILLMLWVSAMRVRYIWGLSKMQNKEDQLTLRDREGDLSILLIFLLVMNQSIFDRFQYSYQPLLRYFHIIIIIMFVIYCALQFTQFVVFRREGLVTNQASLEQKSLKGYKVKKYLYSYKFTIYYTDKKERERDLSFIIGKKNKQVVEERLGNLNVNIV